MGSGYWRGETLRWLKNIGWPAGTLDGPLVAIYTAGTCPTLNCQYDPTGWNVTALRLRSLTVRTALYTAKPIIALESTLTGYLLLHCYTFQFELYRSFDF